MKKLISLLATVAMVSTLFVSVVKADFSPVVTTTSEKLSNSDFNDLIGEDIPTGYDAYLVTISFSNLGDLDCTIKTKKHSGRKLQGFGYQMTFDDIDNVETDYVLSVDNIFGVDLSEGFVGSKFTSIFNAGSAAAAYPTTATTISNATGLPDAAMFVVTVKNDATVVVTLDTNVNVVNYSANVYGEEEKTNHATMSPASLTFAPGPSTVAVTGVTVAPKTLNFTVGDAASTLTATVAPNNATDQTVTWSTSNASVATVANGVVTPVGVGTATITATTTDGSFTDTCAVTVAAAPVPVTGVTLNKDKISIKVGETDDTLEATIAPPAADNTNITWSTSNASVATVSDSGVVTGAGVGTAIITVTTEDGGYTDTCEVEVKAADQTIPAKNSEVGAVDKEDTSKTYTDLTGKTVTMSKNYGIAKFDPTVDTAGKNYFLHATDTDGKDKEWTVNFGELGVEATDVKVTFFAIVKSAGHIIETMELIARAK